MLKTAFEALTTDSSAAGGAEALGIWIHPRVQGAQEPKHDRH